MPKFPKTCALALLGSALNGCGGRAVISEGAAAGGAFNASSAGSASSAAGQSAGGSAPVQIVVIPPAPDSCARFHVKFDASTIGTENPADCPSIECGCPGLYMGPIPTAFGCVLSIDCAAACPAGYDWTGCALAPCLTDLNCMDPGDVCILPEGAPLGQCAPPGHDLCVNAADCSPDEHCVALGVDGARQCVNPQQRHAPCNLDSDCASEHCVLLEGSFLGQCSD